MTTIVKVTACCPDDTEVHVFVEERGERIEHVKLQSGESLERYAYDSRCITVLEQKKPAESLKKD